MKTKGRFSASVTFTYEATGVAPFVDVLIALAKNDAELVARHCYPKSFDDTIMQTSFLLSNRGYDGEGGALNKMTSLGVPQSYRFL
ncbi:TPA: hypothetical protein SJ233_002908 [Legionella pneumophila]|jgi:hypothetical protein|nr:hypothetical protein [Legionella pneumophila]